MCKSRFTEPQIIAVLKSIEADRFVKKVCRKTLLLNNSKSPVLSGVPAINRPVLAPSTFLILPGLMNDIKTPIVR